MFHKFLKAEGIPLLFIAPFLTFPFAFLPGTILSLAIVLWIWLKNWKDFVQVLPSTPFNSALLLWGVSILVGVIVSNTPALTIPKAAGVILGLTLWRFAVIAIQNYQQLRVVLFIFIVIGCSILLSSLFVVQWYAKIPIFQEFTSLFPPLLVRLPGSPNLGVSPNQLAGTILFFLPLTIVPFISWWSQKEYRKIKFFALIAGTFLFLALGLTQSRSGWMGALASILTIMVLYISSSIFNRFRNFSFGRILLVAPVLVFIIGLWFFSTPDVSRIMNSTIEELPPSSSYSFIFRQEVWRVGIQAAGEYPLTGVGLGSFREVFSTLYLTSISPDIDIAHAHNIFLQVALDTGIPGLTAYLAILMVAFFAGWNVIKDSSEYKPLAISILASLAGLHVFGLTDTIAVGSKTHFVFWLVIGIMAGIWQMSKQNPYDIRHYSRP